MSFGFICRNGEQTEGKSSNYRVRFSCYAPYCSPRERPSPDHFLQIPTCVLQPSFLLTVIAPCSLLDRVVSTVTIMVGQETGSFCATWSPKTQERSAKALCTSKPLPSTRWPRPPARGRSLMCKFPPVSIESDRIPKESVCQILTPLSQKEIFRLGQLQWIEKPSGCTFTSADVKF